MVLKKTKRNRRILLWLEIKGLKIHLLDRDVQSGRLTTDLEFYLFKQFQSNKLDELIKTILDYKGSSHQIRIQDLNNKRTTIKELIEKKWINKSTEMIANKIKRRILKERKSLFK